MEINIHMSWPQLTVVEKCKALQAIKMHQRVNIICIVKSGTHVYKHAWVCVFNDVNKVLCTSAHMQTYLYVYTYTYVCMYICNILYTYFCRR